ncbi:hypothetical protein XENOCAPTIV_008787 [Xenoophorus captivus]|uniref:Uncharacterized protein n=1 Tax=Xenoophorus captivus TaxID=1517983 RepID=A0ABV0RRH8_9TELE
MCESLFSDVWLEDAIFKDWLRPVIAYSRADLDGGMRAEVLWCPETVAKHHSYNSNEAIGDLFHNMLLIQRSQNPSRCNKMNYIIKFGLTPHLKRKLVGGVNKAGQFDIMFNKYLFETNQMDINVR